MEDVGSSSTVHTIQSMHLMYAHAGKKKHRMARVYASCKHFAPLTQERNNDNNRQGEICLEHTTLDGARRTARAWWECAWHCRAGCCVGSLPGSSVQVSTFARALAELLSDLGFGFALVCGESGHLFG